ncbi:MAG: preprotein translocase subunit SecY [Candidatus Diapherotrites archaeon]|uniref:Protein translocase subunit SecY n=1 Tax=Candidatus Iainarchaeum sp. TaxID=3101447 RepID=A0A8T4KV74_9ARCH|nr:preprotein translocase subunit SecY [Candidatus Diapherotrites archaeon]
MSFEKLDPLIRMLPEVKAPEKKPVLKKRLLWTAAILILFYILGAIPIIGIQPSSFEQLRLFQDLLASNIGTIMTLGIGPIVLASIVLQLLIGGKFINMDLSNPQDRARFTGMQKLLTIVIAFFEAGAYTGFGLGPSLITPNEGMFIPVLLQVVIGAIIVMYLDEVVSKYGIGSGVGLFIAAGVSQGFFWQLFSPPGLGRAVLFQIFENIASGKVIIALTLIIPIFFAIAIFAAVTFAEGMHINIPIAMGPKGFGGRFPVKLMYVSNMPVILASALFANIQIMSSVITGDNILAMIIKGLSWITQIPRIDSYSILEALLVLGPSQRVFIEILHGVVYIAILVVLCVVFGKFWVELGGQSTESVSNQLQRSGMYIPGFRRDPRIIQGVLNRYIPPITILSSVLVGLLAGFADIITGALVSGVGIMLTVGIVYRMYEELAKEQVSEMNPLLRKFLG